MDFRNQLRLAVRTLWRARATTAVLLVSLALGTGTNAALFTVLDALLFQAPPGVAEPGRLVTIHTSEVSGSAFGFSSYPDWLSLRARLTTVGPVAAFDDTTHDIVRAGDWTERVRVAAITPDLFPLLGLAPHAGRWPDGEGRAPDSPLLAAISFRLWTASGRTVSIGSTVQLGARVITVGAIAPERFSGLQLGRAADVWVPLELDTVGASRGDRRLTILGRLRPGASAEDADAEVRAIGLALASEYPETNRGTVWQDDEPRHMAARPYSRMDPATRRHATLLAALIAAATGLLLVSACVNIGGLLLSRGLARRGEFAVRTALGATPRQMYRDALVETVLVCTAGAVLGLLCAHWTTGAFPAAFAPEEAAMLDVRLRPLTIAATIGLAAGAGLIFALLPAWRMARQPMIDALRQQGPGPRTARRESWQRTLLVTGQLALATVLVVSSGLVLRALDSALSGDIGGDGRGAAVALVRLALLDPVEAAAFQEKAMEAASTMPGVKAVGWVTTLPLGRAPVQSFQIQRVDGFGDTIEAEIAVVSRGYLEAIRTTIVEGRSFSADDAPRTAPVVIVNEILARRFFGRAAAGHHLRDSAGTAYRIVGVTRAERFRTLQRASEPMVYFPLSQRPAPVLHLIARIDREPSAEPGALGARLGALHPRAQVLRTFTLRDHLTEALALDRLTARAVLVCAVGALFLAMVGVYGVVGDVVRRRIPEFALRRALGAGPLRIAGLVAAEALHLVAAGTLTGFALVLLAERVARAVVHGLPPVDLPALASIPLALAVIVLAAIVIPIRRAMSVAPSEALRTQT